MNPNRLRRTLAELSGIIKKAASTSASLWTGDADGSASILDTDGTCINPEPGPCPGPRTDLQDAGGKAARRRSIATSHLVDAVARSIGIEVYETGVGFQVHRAICSFRERSYSGGEKKAQV